MSDRPIIFSAPMIRALLDGKKTQTRRRPKAELQAQYEKVGDGILRRHPNQNGSGWEVGDRLWVREAHAFLGKKGGPPVAYRADASDGERVRVDAPWHSSIHMPRWASRLTLTVTAVRVQRLQDISEEDAEAEGLEEMPPADPPLHAIRRFKVYGKDGENLACPYGARISFSTLWDSLHGPGAWDANQFVVALTFTTTHGNIDQIARAA